jgi:hypothetical protein
MASNTNWLAPEEEIEQRCEAQGEGDGHADDERDDKPADHHQAWGNRQRRRERIPFIEDAEGRAEANQRRADDGPRTFDGVGQAENHHQGASRRQRISENALAKTERRRLPLRILQ